MQEGGPSQGAGASPGGGGGQGGAGVTPERVEVNDDVAALKDQMERARELIKSLNDVSNGVRKGEIDPELLGRLDVARDPGRGGGEAFDRSKTQDKEIGVTSRDAARGDGAEKDGRKDDASDTHKSGDRPTIVDTARVTSGDLSADKLRELIESGRIDVSPEYRRLVERYYRELSESE